MIQGQNHSSGQTTAAGHLHRHRAGKQLPVQGQGEASLPLRAAGHLQRANRPQERLLHPWVHLQEQHKGGRLAGLTSVWPQSVFEGRELHRRVDFGFEQQLNNSSPNQNTLHNLTAEFFFLEAGWCVEVKSFFFL